MRERPLVFRGRGPIWLLAACAACGGALWLGRERPARAEESTTPLLLVLSKSGAALELVDPATMKIVGRVPVGEDPHEVAVSADGRTAFVANYGKQQPGSTLSVVDLASRKEAKRVSLGALRRPHGIAVAGGKVYFTAEVNRVVARYDPQSDQVDWIMGTGQGGTHMLALSPAEDRVYTANIESGTVSVLDRAAGPGAPGVRQVPAGKEPEAIAVSPDGREVWVGSRAGGAITVIDAAAEKVTATLPFQGVPIRLVFTPDGKRVLASDAAGGELVVLDAAARREVRRVPLGKVPVGLLAAPDGKRAYVALAAENRVAAVDLQSLTVSGTVETGPVPDGLAWAGSRPAAPAARPGALGVGVAPVPPALRAELGLKDAEGVLVQAVFPGSAAAAAGLKQGDVLLHLDGSPVGDPEKFRAALGGRRAGDKVRLRVARGPERLEVTATLAPRPLE